MLAVGESVGSVRVTFFLQFPLPVELPSGCHARGCAMSCPTVVQFPVDPAARQDSAETHHHCKLRSLGMN